MSQCGDVVKVVKRETELARQGRLCPEHLGFNDCRNPFTKRTRSADFEGISGEDAS